MINQFAGCTKDLVGLSEDFLLQLNTMSGGVGLFGDVVHTLIDVLQRCKVGRQ
jgi:hypothetical protein